MDASLKQLSNHVWYFPASPAPEKIQPNVGVVLGTYETVLIDAGNTPATAQKVVGELNRIKAPPISKVIYTHHHWIMFLARAFMALNPWHIHFVSICSEKKHQNPGV